MNGVSGGAWAARRALRGRAIDAGDGAPAHEPQARPANGLVARDLDGLVRLGRHPARQREAHLLTPDATRGVRPHVVAITTSHDRDLDRTKRSGPTAGIRISPDASQVAEDFRLFLEVNERPQMVLDVIPIELFSLADDDALHIDPVLWSSSEGFHHDQILRRRGHQENARREFIRCRPSDGRLLEWHAAQRCRAMPPIRQKRQPRSSHRRCKSAAAR